MSPARFTHNVPLSQQVLSILIDRIRRGVYPPESRFPSQNELAEEFSISRATVRSALDALASRGLIVRRQGVGTFVSLISRIANPLTRPILFQDLIAAHGYDPGVRFVGADLVAPNPGITTALAADPESPVLELRKIFTADGVPVIYSVNTLPLWVTGRQLAEAVLDDQTLTEPVFEFLEKHCGHPLRYYISTIRPDLTKNCPIPATEYAPDTLAMVIDETGYTADERPIMHSLHYYPGARMRFELIRSRDQLPGKTSRSRRST